MSTIACPAIPSLSAFGWNGGVKCICQSVNIFSCCVLTSKTLNLFAYFAFRRPPFYRKWRIRSDVVISRCELSSRYLHLKVGSKGKNTLCQWRLIFCVNLLLVICVCCLQFMLHLTVISNKVLCSQLTGVSRSLMKILCSSAGLGLVENTW